MSTASIASWIVSLVITWALWQLLRIANGVGEIAGELRRLRQIAERRRP